MSDPRRITLSDQHPWIFICSIIYYGAFSHAFFSSDALLLKSGAQTQRKGSSFRPHRNNHGFFFFFFCLSKTLAEHYIVTVQWLLLSSSFLFSFFVKKNFAEALIAEKKILLETIQNIDASSTFDRMLWLKLQQW